jgi:hypothetical protein
MHDPLVVAFQMRRPWPRRSLAGRRRWYWPPIVTVWHREPRGRDSGEVCRHYRHDTDTGKTTILHGWRWHVHHWRIQIHAVQELRRRLLTRCAWCGGPHRKADPVNISHQWDGPRGPWWRGERGLYHWECSSIQHAHAMCVCDDPLTAYDGHGRCALCGKSRSYGQSQRHVDRARIVARTPTGQRMPDDVKAAVAEFDRDAARAATESEAS